jgi:hypothetical protein
MAISSHMNQPVLLSPPINIYWLGFRSDTATLYRYGWEFIVERNDYDMTFTICLKHERDKIYGVSARIDDRALMVYSRREHTQRQMPPVEIKIASKITIDERRFEPVSMRPEMSMEDEIMQFAEPYSIEYFFNKFEKFKLPKGKRIYKPETDGMKRRLDILVGEENQ